MFSVPRFDPALAALPASQADPHSQETVPSPFSRLNARLEAKRKAAESTNAHPSSNSCLALETPPPSFPPQEAKVIGPQPEADQAAPETSPAKPSLPLTRKQKARLELGLTGANSIPLPSLGKSKPKTKAKQKYLKRKKLRHQARKKNKSTPGKSKAEAGNGSPQDTVTKLEGSHDQNTPLDNELQGSSYSDCCHATDNTVQSPSEPEHVKERKRPRNLDPILQSISKKRKKDDVCTAAKDEEEVGVSPSQSQAISQPGALPRFPAPLNPAPPDSSLLARFAMGLGQSPTDDRDVDNNVVQLNPDVRLDLAEVQERGECQEFTPALRLSRHSHQQLAELKIKSFLPVQTAVFSLLLPPLGPSHDTHPSLLYPTRHPPRDICVSGPTGSGKTLSYILPIVEWLSSRIVVRLRALIVLPTRDLVLQVKHAFDQFSRGTGIKSTIVTGQHSFAQEQALLGRSGVDSEAAVDVVIATPGRLLDHLHQTPGFSLAHLCFLVLDEADQLLNKSQTWLYQVLSHRPSFPPLQAFIGPLESAVKCLEESAPPTPASDHRRWDTPLAGLDPCKTRPFRILMFSATLTQDPTKLSHLGLRRPIYVKIGHRSDNLVQELNSYTLPSTLKQHLIVTRTSLKPLVWFHLIQSHKIRKALCFCKSVEGATRLTCLHKLLIGVCVQRGDALASSLGTAACFSSELPVKARKKMLAEFESGRIDMLVCSDVIARGLDISHVEHVINYDSPVDAKKYVHRVGRTARAGKSGTAWSLVESQEARFLKKSLKGALGEDSWEDIQKVRVGWKQVEYLTPLYEAALQELGTLFGRSVVEDPMEFGKLKS